MENKKISEILLNFSKWENKLNPLIRNEMTLSEKIDQYLDKIENEKKSPPPNYTEEQIMDKICNYLEEKYLVSSSGESASIHRLIKFYREHKNKIFDKEEVEKLIKTTIEESAISFMEYVKNETIIIDKLTNKEIVDAEIDLKQNHKPIKDYIYSRLKDKGIEFKFDD